jgi:hypothetical protein
MEMAEETVKKETAFLNVGIHMSKVNSTFQDDEVFLKYLEVKDKGEIKLHI